MYNSLCEAGRNNTGRANLLDESALHDGPFDGIMSVYSAIVHLNGRLMFEHLIKEL